MSLLQIRITPEQHKQLKQLALDSDTTVSELMRLQMFLLFRAAK